MEWQEAGETQYNVGMGKWTAHRCYVLKHQTALKRIIPGDIMPAALRLYGYTVKRHEYKGKGACGIKLESDKLTPSKVRLYVSSGDEAERDAWVAAIERACKGQWATAVPPLGTSSASISPL